MSEQAPEKRKNVASELLIAVLIIVALVVLGAIWNSSPLPPTSSPSSGFTSPAASDLTKQPNVQFSKPRWETSASGAFTTVTTEVKNVGSSTLEAVRMQVSFYDKADVFVKSEEAFLDLLPLRTGDISPVKVMLPADPRLHTYRLQFACRGSGFDDVRINATQVAKLR